MVSLHLYLVYFLGEGTPTTPTPELLMIQPHVTHIVQFITVVAQDSEHSDGNVAACAGLIGLVVFLPEGGGRYCNGLSDMQPAGYDATCANLASF
jgi:hypothetical protein